MQTFLPYKDFTQSAKALDYRRLGKQRIEAKQILMILLDETTSTAWRNHPAVKMWRSYEHSLADYGVAMCTEWRARGFVDNQLPYFTERTFAHKYPWSNGGYYYPHWLGDERFHRAHRSNLLRKNPDFYRQLWPLESDSYPYIWPDPMVVKV